MWSITQAACLFLPFPAIHYNSLSSCNLRSRTGIEWAPILIPCLLPVSLWILNFPTKFPILHPGPCLNIKTVFSRHGDSHVKDKTVAETILSLTWESLYWQEGIFIWRRHPVVDDSNHRNREDVISTTLSSLHVLTADELTWIVNNWQDNESCLSMINFFYVPTI